MALTAGNLIVISAPSGAGKTSLVHDLLTRDAQISVSVSHTTRAKRPSEIDGEDYFFVEREQFQRMVTNDEFLEHAEVFGNFYGTSTAQVEDILNLGRDLVLEIDWQGARKIRENFPQAISIFVLPPSEMALRERLIERGDDDPEVIERRMRAAMNEMSHFREYDYLLINDVFDEAATQLWTIVRAGRLTTRIQRLSQAAMLEKLIAPLDAV